MAWERAGACCSDRRQQRRWLGGNHRWLSWWGKTGWGTLLQCWCLRDGERHPMLRVHQIDVAAPVAGYGHTAAAGLSVEGVPQDPCLLWLRKGLLSHCNPWFLGQIHGRTRQEVKRTWLWHRGEASFLGQDTRLWSVLCWPEVEVGWVAASLAAASCRCWLLVHT